MRKTPCQKGYHADHMCRAKARDTAGNGSEFYGCPGALRKLDGNQVLEWLTVEVDDGFMVQGGRRFRREQAN